MPFVVGQRVKLTAPLRNDNSDWMPVESIPVGTGGTVVLGHNASPDDRFPIATVHWDNGRTLGVFTFDNVEPIKMVYANTSCTLTFGEDADEKQTVTFSGSCVNNCGVHKRIVVDGEQAAKFLNGDGYIQDTLSDLSAGDREFLLSGTCDYCWNKLFKDEGDEDE